MEANRLSTDSDLISLIEVTGSEPENSNDSELISLIEIDEDNQDEDDVRIENNQHNENQIMCNQVELKCMHRAVRNHRKCLACEEKTNLHRPSESMRRFFSKSKKIYIQKNDRVCNFHCERENWDHIQCRESSYFSGAMIDEMVTFLLKSPVESFRLTDIGLDAVQFKQVLRELRIPENPNKIQKKVEIDVKLYLERLRNGHTYEQMAHSHNMKRRSVGQKVKKGRNLLLEHFVPQWIGFENLSRQFLLEHTTDLARMLYCNNDPKKAVTIWDGTYIYTCNTSNHTHQRKIFSGQKHRHLFKIMKIVATDGTIIDVFGPFEATINDANILKKIFEQTSIGKMYNAGDIVLLDRGFRDCVKFLENKKIVVKIPAFVQKGTNGQLTTKQANQSRLVSKMRFIIEAANGRMKNKWHLFGKIVPSILSRNLMSDYRIGAALLNAFGKPTTCDKNDFAIVGANMIGLVDIDNKLQPTIVSKVFNKAKKYFRSIEPSDLIFPRFNEENLKMFSLGTFAKRQAISYIAEHIRLHGKFEVSTFPTAQVWAHFGRICIKANFNNPMLIHAGIKSRFKGRITHDVYILYDTTDNCTRSNFFYLCSCQHGRRTLGCCSHVMSVVLYFGYSRYENERDPAAHLNDFFDTFA